MKLRRIFFVDSIPRVCFYLCVILDILLRYNNHIAFVIIIFLCMQIIDKYQVLQWILFFQNNKIIERNALKLTFETVNVCIVIYWDSLLIFVNWLNSTFHTIRKTKNVPNHNLISKIHGHCNSLCELSTF